LIFAQSRSPLKHCEKPVKIFANIVDFFKQKIKPVNFLRSYIFFNLDAKISKNLKIFSKITKYVHKSHIFVFSENTQYQFKNRF